MDELWNGKKLLNDCLVTLSGATKLCLGLSISIVMTFSCIILLVLPEVTATNFSKDPLVACDQISSLKESSTPGISYQTMYISTPLMHLKEVCQMLISLLLLNATKSKLYIHFVCFWLFPLNWACLYCSFFSYNLFIVLFCIVCLYIYFLISGCCKNRLQPSIPAVLLD